tara:strand:+ start:21846 stop:23039 length:1194 start_codon:yes stop_codon:yes gene_type:complete
MPVEEALGQLLASVTARPEAVERALLDALGCTLAEDVVSLVDVPPHNDSAMDGYAVRASETAQVLPVIQRIAAGQTGDPLEPNTAARIFTGAPVPQGADAVVMQENCSVKDGMLTISGSVSAGQNIRPRGQDVATGSVVLQRGRRLRAQDLGLLASLGCATVMIHRPLRVAIFSTGDELVEPGQGTPLSPGQLYNSNRYTLAGLLRAMNLEVIDGGIIADDPDATRTALSQASTQADCVITSGGVSVGEEDHVKQQVQELGQLELWRLAIKPGKPLAFGRIGATPFVGLPGNPTSVFVTFCVIAAPFLRALQGTTPTPVLRQFARAEFEISRPGIRQEYLRVVVSNSDSGLCAAAYSNQSSGVLSSVSHCNALAVIPVGATVSAGDSVEVMLLDALL